MLQFLISRPSLAALLLIARAFAIATGLVMSVTRGLKSRRKALAALDALRQSETRYRILADNASDVIIHYDLEFRPLYMSPSTAQLGHDPKALVEQPHCLDLVHPDDQALAIRREQLALTGASTPSITARLCRADGGWVWFESTLTPVRDDNGAISSFISPLRG